MNEWNDTERADSAIKCSRLSCPLSQLCEKVAMHSEWRDALAESEKCETVSFVSFEIGGSFCPLGAAGSLDSLPSFSRTQQIARLASSLLRTTLEIMRAKQ